MRDSIFLSGLIATAFVLCLGLPDSAHALSDTEKTAAEVGNTIGAAEFCQLSNNHRQLMWTEAYSELSRSARNDRELKRAKETLQKNYEKTRTKSPKGGCRNFMVNNPDPTIQTMKTVQQLQKKIDTYGKILMDNKINAQEESKDDNPIPQSASPE